MSRIRLAHIGIMVVACLVFPREARAGFWNLIWGLEPQLMGTTVVHCRFEKAGQFQEQCRFLEIKKTEIGALRSFEERSFWFSFEGNFFVADGKNPSNDNKYKPFETQLIALEPVVEFRLPALNRFYFGAGATLDAVHTNEHSVVYKNGVKLLADFVFNVHQFPLDAGVVLRLYPQRFTAEDFGFDVRPGDPRTGPEWVLGFSINQKW